MKIIWKNLEDGIFLRHEHSINLEYEIRLQVIQTLIKEAEHLMDYLYLVVVEINPSDGYVSVHPETPEPLFSKIAKNLEQPIAGKFSKASSPLLAAVNF